ATRLLVGSLAPLLPVAIAFDPTPDWRVLTATVAFAVSSALVFGLGPALKLARTDTISELKDQAGEVRRRARFAAGNLLVTGRMARTFMLRAAAGLFVRSAVQAAASNPGFTFDRGVVIRVDPSLAGYAPAR